MFDDPMTGIGLWPGEGPEDQAEIDSAYRLTCLELEEGWVGPNRHLLPDELESIPVGPYLAAVVGSVDRSRLNGHDAVRVLQAESRLIAWLEAARSASIAEVAFCPPGGPDDPVEREPAAVEYAAVEVAAALTLTRRSAERHVDTALTLQDRLRRVWDRFASGEIDSTKVRELVSQLAHLDPVTIDAVLDRILDHARNLTTGQLRARIARLVMETDPDGAASGFQEGLRDRKVVSYANPDFTASLGILSGHPIEINRAITHVDQIARGLKVDGEERSLDQIRTDVALDLLQGKCGCGTAPRSSGGVHLKVDVATLAELSEIPGELAGYGPVIADIARKTVLDQVECDWTYTVTEGDRVLATGTTRRRPTPNQRRWIESEYETCTFVGCRMPASDCDLDHRRPYSQGGPTHNDNLGPLCRHHHMARHHAPWLLIRLPNGDHRWTSPLGHTYIRERAPPD